MSALTPEQVERLACPRCLHEMWAHDDLGCVSCFDCALTDKQVIAALIAEAVEQARADVAEQIEARYLGADFGRGYDGREGPQAALTHAYDAGLEMAARIARGEVSP